MAIITYVFIVMLCMIGALCAIHSSSRRENICNTLSHICAHISRISGIFFLFMLLLACNYEHIKSLMNAILPAQGVEEMKVCITFLFSSPSALSALHSALIYLFLISCLSGLSAIVFVRLKIYGAGNVEKSADIYGVKSSSRREYRHVFLKPCLIYSKYNS